MSTGNWASSGEDQWTSACPRAVRGGLAAPLRRVAKIGEPDFADMIVLCRWRTLNFRLNCMQFNLKMSCRHVLGTTRNC